MKDAARLGRTTLSIAWALIACAPAAPPGTVGWPVAVVVPPGVARVVVHVRALGAPGSRTIELRPRDGVAEGVAAVEVGPACVVSAVAYDAMGLVTHAGEATVDVESSAQPAVAIALRPRAGEATLALVLGAAPRAPEALARTTGASSP